MMGGLHKPSRGTRRPAGRATYTMPPAAAFTVVEVLIVLAVSGLLFVSAAIMIAGRQNQTAFDQAIQQVQAQIRQTINDVSSGFLPNNANFQCASSPIGPSFTTGGGTGSGTNSGCVFLGKAIQFKAGAAVTDPEQYSIFTIAGLQKGGPGGAESSTLAEALPMAVAPSTLNPTAPNLTETDNMQNGLTTLDNTATPPYGMWYDDGTGQHPIGAVAFVSSLAPPSGGPITSGSQQVNIIPVGGSALSVDPTAIADAINTNLKNAVLSPPNPSNGISICFVSGGTDQSGLITIGGSGRELAVNLSIKSNKQCQ